MQRLPLAFVHKISPEPSLVRAFFYVLDGYARCFIHGWTPYSNEKTGTLLRYILTGTVRATFQPNDPRRDCLHKAFLSVTNGGTDNVAQM